MIVGDAEADSPHQLGDVTSAPTLKYSCHVIPSMATDRNGYALTAYPDSFENARLIGITNDGYAAYHDGGRVFLAERDEAGVTTPPAGYGPWHEVDLDGFEWTVGDYIVETAIDEGPWRALSEYGDHHMRQVGHNHLGIVQ